VKHFIQFCFTITLLLILGSTANAGVTLTLFGTTTSGKNGPSTLYTINTNTGAATEVGPVGNDFERCGSLACNSSDNLFAVCERSADDEQVLVSINSSTGDGTEIGPLNQCVDYTDISFRNSNQQLFGFGFSGSCSFPDMTVVTINTANGQAAIVGGLVSNDGCCGNALAFSPGDTLFYANEKNLHTLSTSTGDSTSVIALDFPPLLDNEPRPNASAFEPGGTLFASIVNGIDPPEDWFLANINTSTGDVSVIGQTVDGLDGIAFCGDAPITEPPPGPPVVVIPTMGQWGMIVAIIILGFFAVIALRRRTES